MCVSVVNTL